MLGLLLFSLLLFDAAVAAPVSGCIVTDISVSSSSTKFVAPQGEDFRPTLVAINARIADENRGDLYRLSNDFGPIKAVSNLLMAPSSSCELTLQINPFPTIYKDWVFENHGINGFIRQQVLNIWQGIPRILRPTEGFFYWLQMCVALAALRDNEDAFAFPSALISWSVQSKQRLLQATDRARLLLLYPSSDNDLLNDFEAAFVFEWAAAHPHAVGALMDHLRKTEVISEWWHLDAVTQNRLDECTSMPAAPKNIPLVDTVMFVIQTV